MNYFKEAIYIFLILSGAILSTGCKYIAETNDSHQNPNIIFILADDLGYGDISALNTKSKIITPLVVIVFVRGSNPEF